MTSEGGPFRILVTANAFMDSGEAVARPLVEAGGAVVHAPQAGPLTEEQLREYLVDCDAVIKALSVLSIHANDIPERSAA